MLLKIDEPTVKDSERSEVRYRGKENISLYKKYVSEYLTEGDEGNLTVHGELFATKKKSAHLKNILSKQ
uniref:Uncharacterized protein n=1 Tax=Onchocerca volvulus TaxID=6282 RepID=A0A8R1TWF9_ONCVO